MGKWLVLFALVPLVAALAACKMNVTPKLYTSDLRHLVTDRTADLTTPGTLAIQIPSADNCAEYTERLSKVIGTLIIGFSPKGCEDVGMEAFLEADIQIPVLLDEEAWTQANSLFGVIVSTEDASGSLGVHLRLDAAKYQLLNDRVYEEFFQKLDLAESRVAVELISDERTDVAFWTNDVFVNGEPVRSSEGAKFTLSRRGTAEIVLSNVGVAWMERGNDVLVILLEHSPS